MRHVGKASPDGKELPPALQEEYKELGKRLTALYDDCNVKPFGNRATVQNSAAALRDWADDSTHKVFSKARIDKDGAKVLLRRLCDLNAAQIPDFDSARQIIFAIQVVHAEWDPKHQKDREVKETLAKLESELDLWSSSRKDEGREER